MLIVDNLNILGKKARTDEEYKDVLKGKIKICVLMCIAGLLTLGAALIAASGKIGHQASFLSGIYTGVGGGVLVASIVKMVRIRGILKDVGLVRKNRLEAQDERNILIAQRAQFMAGTILFVIAYVGLLVAGFFNMTVFWTLWTVVVLYIVLYLFIRWYYNSKM